MLNYYVHNVFVTGFNLEINQESLTTACGDYQRFGSQLYVVYELLNFVLFYLIPVAVIVLSYASILHTIVKKRKVFNNKNSEFFKILFYKLMF